MTDRQRQRELGRLWRAFMYAAGRVRVVCQIHGNTSPQAVAAWKEEGDAYERWWAELQAAGTAGHRLRGGTVVALPGQLRPTLKQARKR
jgi:hypothetical protein